MTHEMTHISEAPNHAAMGKPTPAATGRPYLTVGEVIRAGPCRAAARKDMAAAKSTWDSEGGATDLANDPRRGRDWASGAAGALKATGTAPGSMPRPVVYSS
jgi:hypothetical protein